MAEARSAVTEPHANKGHDDASDSYVLWRKSLVRRFFRKRNEILNGVWPTSVWNLVAAMLGLTALQSVQHPLLLPVQVKLHTIADRIPPHTLPVLVRNVWTSTVMGVAFFVVMLYTRQFTLRGLLAYRGWMYEPPKSQSFITLLWGGLVRLVSGSHPSLYSYQRSLPRLPVPSLQMTMSNLLTSLEPLFEPGSEEFQTLQKEAKDFEKTMGPKLQRMLVARSWWVENFVSDWWEKYVYLMGRSPLPINSNYYIMDQCYWKPTHRPASRAASTVYQLLLKKFSVDREELEPLLIRGTIPLCMAQYERTFSTVRIPGEELDTLMHYESKDSKHLVVMRKGIMYRIEGYDRKGNIRLPQDLEQEFEWIMEDADNWQDSYTEEEKSLPALTTLDRSTWARTREKYFSSGINKESLDTIEKAIVFVVLDTLELDDLSERASALLHGSGTNIWFDKSCSLIFFQNGRYGLNCEHSFADAPVMGHMQEFNMLNEILWAVNEKTVGMFALDGRCLPVPQDGQRVPAEAAPPKRLSWDIPSPLASQVQAALQLHQKNAEDLDLLVRDHTAFGKGFIKKCKVSPDAFVQMALQVTYMKNAGKLALTYESSMTRLYLHGRTETVRSLTPQAKAFVQAFMDKSVTNKEKIRLLRIACENHAKLYKDAMNGQGVDRHLFALYIVSRGLGYECDFLKKALSFPWTLSTSQQPQQQIAWAPDCGLPQFRDMLSPGGGFGPVADDGYGVSYMVPGDHRIFFHVSSKHSNPNTSSAVFLDQLFETLQEMKELFKEDIPPADYEACCSCSQATKTPCGCK